MVRFWHCVGHTIGRDLDTGASFHGSDVPRDDTGAAESLIVGNEVH